MTGVGEARLDMAPFEHENGAPRAARLKARGGLIISRFEVGNGFSYFLYFTSRVISLIMKVHFYEA